MTFPQRFVSAAFGSLLILSAMPVQRAFAQNSPAAAVNHVKVIPASAQAQISAVLGRDQKAYQAAARPGGFEMKNPKHKLAAQFTQSGIKLRAGSADWSLTLRGYGHGDKLIAGNAVVPQASANRVEYRRGKLTEWYVNGPLGLEQGFTVAQSPGKSASQPLTLALSISGSLAASVDSGGRGLTLKKDGTAALHYGGLTAHDSTGRELRAWMESSRERLWLRVDDAGAQYPVVVDPVMQEATLTSLAGTQGDLFATSVAVSGDTIVVGARQSGDLNSGPGAVYVFLKPGAGWSGDLHENAKLTASDAGGSAHFGFSVAVSDDTVVAGEDGSGVRGAYVFVKPAGGWADATETAKLTASDGVAGDEFSYSVGVSGGTVVVGAFGATPTSMDTSRGAAYVFVKPAGTWVSGTETVKLAPSDSAANDGFGLSVAISGDTIVVGDGNGSDNSAAYVFVKPTGGWGSPSPQNQAAKLTPANGTVLFGVGVSGDTVVAGADIDTVNGHTSQGSVYVFVKPAGLWVDAHETAKLIASDGVANDGLPFAVVAGSDTVAAVSFGAGSTNAAYAWVKPTTGWSGTLTETGKLSPTDGGKFNAVGVDGATMVAGNQAHKIAPNDEVGWAIVSSVSSQTTPIITWGTPTAITFGAALTTTQLNATANTMGTFIYDPPLTTILGAGPQTLQVTFNPDDTTDFTSATAQVILQVNKATPLITWTPASIQLGFPLGAAQLDATANVQGMFAYTPVAGTTITTITQTLSAVFTPMDATDYNTANAMVALTVTAGPVANVAPTSIDFGTLYLGSIVTRNVTVSNVGNAAMTITNPFIGLLHGGNSNEYVVVSLCPKSLAAGKSCTMTVAFVAGPFFTQQTATLNVMDNAPGNPQPVSLTAAVINPQASLSTNSLNFGSQKVSTPSAAKTVTIRNTGTTALAINSVTITGANPADFIPNNGCGPSLGPNLTCNISVVFQPTAKNSRSATLRIADNAQSGTQLVTLSGTGK